MTKKKILHLPIDRDELIRQFIKNGWSPEFAHALADRSVSDDDKPLKFEPEDFSPHKEVA